MHIHILSMTLSYSYCRLIWCALRILLVADSIQKTPRMATYLHLMLSKQCINMPSDVYTKILSRAEFAARVAETFRVRNLSVDQRMS